MKNNLYLLLTVLSAVLFILPAVSAQYYKVNIPVQLKFTCTLNGAIPSNNAAFNISVDNPNGTQFIAPKTATLPLDSGLFLYNTSFTNIGVYTIHEFCWDGVDSYSNTEEINVNGTGTELSTGQGIMYVIFIIFGFGLFLLSLFWSIKIPFKNQRDDEGKVININDLKYIKIFLIVITYMILMTILGLSRGIAANYIPEIGIAGMFEWMYWIMLSFMWPLIICSLIFALILWLSDKKMEKRLLHDFPDMLGGRI